MLTAAGTKEPKISVLYVDDESVLLQIGKAFLERSGDFIVTTETSAPGAVRLLESEKFDAIISDYQMPDMNGIEFLKVVRAQGDPTPFIIFTGKGREEVVIEALNSGADFYIQKGGEPKAQFAELAHKIRRAVEHRTDARALKESEERFRQLFSGMPSGAAIYEAVDDGGDFIIRDFNAAGEAIDQIKKEQVLGRRVTEIFPGVKEFGIFSAFQRVWRTGKPEYLPSAIYHDGRLPGAWRENWVYRLPAGEIVAIYNDITDRKQAEAAVAESEERFRAIFDSARDGMLIADIETRRFVMANKAMLEMTGYPEQELLSMSVTDIIPPADPQSSIKQFDRQARGEKNLSSEIMIQRKDGTVLYTDISSSTVTLQGKLYTIGIFRDITERKTSEQSLKMSQVQLAEAMDLAHMANWEFDVASGIFTFNDRFYALYGTTAEREGGYEMPADVYAREFVHPDEAGLVAREVQNAIHATDPDYSRQIEHRIIRRDGEIRHIVVRFGITKDADGRTVKTHGANQDITERKRVEEALRQANKQLNLLSSITRHDINNQLMVLKGYLDLSHEAIDDPANLAEYIQKEEKAANMIEQQITFTKDYQELGATEPAWQNVNACIKKAVTGLPVRDIHVEVDPNNPEIFADQLFEKVFYNLIDNALKYGGDRMKIIRTSSEETGTGLRIVCEDDGVGISAEDRKQLFSRGFGKNTGLGLFLSREILAITGITIAENGAPGKGARFEITVPKGAYRFTGTGGT